MSSNPTPIHSMTADVTYLKGKRIHKTIVWIITRFEEPTDIMEHDESTMSRLDLEIYGKNYKSTKKIVITNIRSKKVVGEVNKNAIHG